jgi:hypothetical protein
MTTPTTTMNDAFTALNTAITSNTVTTNTAPPGAVQAAINYDALITAVADYGLLTADALNVFAEDFQAAITELLAAGTLAASIVAAIAGVADAGKP